MGGEVLDFLLANDGHFRSPRLPSLYSDFRRQRYTNSDGYAANIEAWTSGLLKAARAGLIPGCEQSTFMIQTGPDLLQALESREWGQPAALGTFMEEAVRSGEIVPLVAFRQAVSSTKTANSFTSPWQMLSWAIAQFGIVPGGASNLIEGRYILLANLRDSAGRVARACQTRCGTLDGLIPMNEFTALATKSLGLPVRIPKEDLEALLLYLSREEHKIVYNDSLVKVPLKGERTSAITEHDGEVASVKSLIYELSETTSSIEAEIDKLTKEAQAAVLTNNRNAALRYLRSRKVQEKLLKQRSSVLTQLEDVYRGIEEAATNIDIMEALKAGTASLRHYNKESGGVETVESILQEVNEEITKTDEIGTVITENPGSNQVYDEVEIDAELASLSAEEKQVEDSRTAEDLAHKFEALERTDPDAEVSKIEQRPEIAEQHHTILSGTRTEKPSATLQSEASATMVLQE